ncbi:MAG: hypothetical protein RL693_2723 [Verrucomicrobiota bacterium]|jgi:AraC-like DNA-binding protein
MNQPEDTQDLVSRLAKSELFLRYRDAFGLATGCTITLSSDGQSRKINLEQLPFVVDFREPVQIGSRAVAYLSLYPVRLSDGEFASFDAVAHQMLDEGCTASNLRAAQHIYDKTPSMSGERCEALRVMLRLFALQLGELAEKLFLEQTENEPPAVIRARQYIINHLMEPLALEEVAQHSGVSPFHFCKIFKKATRLTFTDFVNRARVELAKRLLLKPQFRITEVAYDAGFQSLSQFNRSFRRIMKQSPKEFRAGKSGLKHQEYLLPHGATSH